MFGEKNRHQHHHNTCHSNTPLKPQTSTRCKCGWGCDPPRLLGLTSHTEILANVIQYPWNSKCKSKRSKALSCGCVAGSHSPPCSPQSHGLSSLSPQIQSNTALMAWHSCATSKSWSGVRQGLLRRRLKAGLLNLGTADTVGWIIPCCGGLPCAR